MELVRQWQDNTSEKSFIERYGLEEGKNNYVNFITANKQKVLKAFKRKFGDVKGLEEYQKYRGQLNFPSSKQSRKFFNILIEFLSQELTFLFDKNEFYFKIPEIYGSSQYGYYFDFFIPELNVVVEYFGDKFHANPKVFKETDTPHPYTSLSSLEIWIKDKERFDICKKENLDVYVVWESSQEEDLKFILQQMEKKYGKGIFKS